MYGDEPLRDRYEREHLEAIRAAGREPDTDRTLAAWEPANHTPPTPAQALRAAAMAWERARDAGRAHYQGEVHAPRLFEPPCEGPDGQQVIA